MSIEISQLIAGLSAPTQKGKWASAAQWLTDGKRVVALSVPEKASEAWTLLALALEYRERVGAEAIDLVLPDAAAEPTANRAALLNVPVRVFIREGDGCRPHDLPTFDDAVTWFGQLGPVRGRKPHDLTGWPGWLLDLADYVEARTIVRERSVDHSWQFRGRQILKVGKSKGNWVLRAGKDNSVPQGNQPTVLTIGLQDEPSADQVADLRMCVDQAIENRRTGRDAEHPESLLQAALAVAPELVGSIALKREFPVWRPQGSGSLDFLGVNEGGHLQLIETKIGDDKQLGIQGLDYWGWVAAHQEALLEGFDVPTPQHPEPPVVRFVLGCSEKRLMHAAARATIAALHERIPWRVHTLTDWNTLAQPGRLLQPRNVQRLNERVLPDHDICDQT